MDRDTLINSIKEIGSCENNVDRLAKLTTLQEDIDKVFNDKTGLETEIKTLKESLVKKDEEIQRANKYAMDMFLKVGEQKTENQVQSEKRGIKEEEKKEYKSYKDLAKNYM